MNIENYSFGKYDGKISGIKEKSPRCFNYRGNFKLLKNLLDNKKVRICCYAGQNGAIYLFKKDNGHIRAEFWRNNNILYCTTFIDSKDSYLYKWIIDKNKLF